MLEIPAIFYSSSIRLVESFEVIIVTTSSYTGAVWIENIESSMMIDELHTMRSIHCGRYGTLYHIQINDKWVHTAHGTLTHSLDIHKWIDIIAKRCTFRN